MWWKRIPFPGEPAGERERRRIAAQLGRDPRGEVGVAVRCEHGLPAVLRTSPVLEDGTPFPTLNYLVCPIAVAACGRLEAAGKMREYESRLAADPGLAAAYREAHDAYLADRKRVADLPGAAAAPGSARPGGSAGPGTSAGGMPERVKCLHALVAHDLADANPIGALARQAVDPLTCPGPCVEERDGTFEAVPGHPAWASRSGRRRRARRKRRAQPTVPARAPGDERRVGVIDVGTNSVRRLAAELRDGRLVTLDRDLVITRLGERVDRTGHLGEEPLRRTVAAIAEAWTRLRDAGIPRVRIAATSAVRDAGNREAFLEAVRAATGVDPEVLSGEQEARLAFLGATADLPPDADPVLVVDIGGGSTELVHGEGGRVRSWVSLDIGSVRLTERHIHDDPPSERSLGAVAKDAGRALARGAESLGLEHPAGAPCIPTETPSASPEVAAPPRPARTLLGLAGTITTLAALSLGLPGYERDAIHHSRLAATEIRRLRTALSAMTSAERRALPAMPRGREGVIMAGTVILEEILARFGFAECLVSEADILDGLALDLAAP